MVEYWQPDRLNLTLFIEPGASRVKVRRGNDLLPPVFHLDRNRSWIDWIGADCLQEEVAYRGMQCNRYEKTIQIPSPEDPAVSTTAIYQAWIEAKTLRPVAFDDGEVRYEIKYNGEVPPVTLPPSVQRELKEYQALLSPAKRR